MKNTKGFAILPVFLVVLGFVAVSTIVFKANQVFELSKNKNNQVALPQESKNQITIEQIKSGSVAYCDSDNKMVPLSQGGFSDPAVHMSIVLTKGKIVSSLGRDYIYGDLNGDGLSDLVAVFDCLGSNNQRSLYFETFLNVEGKPQYIATQALGDGTSVNSLSISDSTIVLGLVISATKNQKEVYDLRKYKLVGTRLILQEVPKPAFTATSSKVLLPKVIPPRGELVIQTPESMKTAKDFFNAQYLQSQIDLAEKKKHASSSTSLYQEEWNEEAWSMEQQNYITGQNHSSYIPFGQTTVPVIPPNGCTVRGIVFESRYDSLIGEDTTAPFEIIVQSRPTDTYQLTYFCKENFLVDSDYKVTIANPIASTIMLPQDALSVRCNMEDTIKVAGIVNGKIVDLTTFADVFVNDSSIADLSIIGSDIYYYGRKKGVTTGTIVVGGKTTTFSITVSC